MAPGLRRTLSASAIIFEGQQMNWYEFASGKIKQVVATAGVFLVRFQQNNALGVVQLQQLTGDRGCFSPHLPALLKLKKGMTPRPADVKDMLFPG